MKLELDVYDTNMTRIGMIEKITSFIWTRRYWEVGDFKLLVPYTEQHAALLAKRNIIMMRGENEAAEIRYMHIKKNAEGFDEIEVQGKFVTNWISKRLIQNQIVTNSTSQEIIYRIINENVVNPSNQKRKIPRFFISDTDADTGSGIIEYASVFYANACLEIAKISKSAKIGFKLLSDGDAQQHFFSVYKGRDLTDKNTAGNPPCIFSREYENVIEPEFTSSVENFKTTAFVGGEEQKDVARKIIETGADFSGLEREEVFISATDIKQTYKDENDREITLTNAQLEAALKTRGDTVLDGYSETLAFSSKINQYGNISYKTDFDVGDRVTCIDKRWGVRIDVRITEITETYQGGVVDIDITFGESIPTLLNQIRQIVN